MQYTPAQASRNAYYLPTDRIFSPLSAAHMPMSSLTAIPSTHSDWAFPPDSTCGFPEPSDPLFEMLRNDTYLPLSSPHDYTFNTNVNPEPNTAWNSEMESMFKDLLDVSQIDCGTTYTDSFGEIPDVFGNNGSSAHPSSSFWTETGTKNGFTFSETMFQAPIFLEETKFSSVEADDLKVPYNHELFTIPSPESSSTSSLSYSPPPSSNSSPSADSRKHQRSTSEDSEESHHQGYIKSFDANGLTIYICRTCPDRKTRSHGDITRHLESLAHKPRSHKCESCGSAFTRADALARHIRAIHDKVRKNTKGRGKRARVD